MPNPIGDGDHLGPLIFFVGRRLGGFREENMLKTQNNKGAWVVATPDGVWHRDSHYTLLGE